MRIYRYIIRFKRMQAGDSPTRREIAAGVGLASSSTVQLHIGYLVAAGLVETKFDQARRIQIPGASWTYSESHVCANNARAAGQ